MKKNRTLKMKSKIMKKMMLIVALLITMTMSAVAQPRALSQEEKEKIFNGKAQMMQKRLRLTDEQMKDFLPIYKEYQEDIAKIGRPKKSKCAHDTTLTSAEAYEFQMSKLKFHEDIVKAQKKAMGKLKTVLKPNQIMRFFEVEKDVQKHIRDHKIGRKAKMDSLKKMKTKRYNFNKCKKGDDDKRKKSKDKKRKKD